ncbi:hypothetical protein SAMN05444920_116221 [Nonomuraea solani]|uniref:Replication initiation protein n=1 Tax=Nonomuraea solani TaxID=1144553 RepID=A0A1H6ETX0_9ACTN|nr:hypothetical protein SAMN05444920_116221 [Nonomuraea solani]
MAIVGLHSCGGVTLGSVSLLSTAGATIGVAVRAAAARDRPPGRMPGRRASDRQDAPDLPKRKMSSTTLGRTFEAADGRTYRPSLFITLTLPSYGKVMNGAPVDPDTYDYVQAARDALHFSKLVDRFVQNLRRVAGYDVQYFATVEPQKRLAPHLHMAVRGTLPRAEMKQIAAATYHQIWWPQTDEARFEGDHLPVWNDGIGYVDPDTGEVLRTWDEALDQLGDEPMHVIRFGDQVDVKGVLAGSPTSASGICPSTSRRALARPWTGKLNGSTRPASSMPFATSRAHPPAQTGCATAYSPRTPSPGCSTAMSGSRSGQAIPISLRSASGSFDPSPNASDGALT